MKVNGALSVFTVVPLLLTMRSGHRNGGRWYLEPRRVFASWTVAANLPVALETAACRTTWYAHETVAVSPRRRRCRLDVSLMSAARSVFVTYAPPVHVMRDA